MKRVLPFCLLSFLIVSIAYGQVAPNGIMLQGRVYEIKNGTGIASLAVKLIPEDATNKAEKITLTDSAGTYRFSGLAPGKYTIAIQFGQTRVYAAPLSINQNTRHDIGINRR